RERNARPPGADLVATLGMTMVLANAQVQLQASQIKAAAQAAAIQRSLDCCNARYAAGAPKSEPSDSATRRSMKQRLARSDRRNSPIPRSVLSASSHGTATASVRAAMPVGSRGISRAP